MSVLGTGDDQAVRCCDLCAQGGDGRGGRVLFTIEVGVEVRELAEASADDEWHRRRCDSSGGL